MAMKETGEGPELSQISATHGPQGSVVAASKDAEAGTLLPGESFTPTGRRIIDPWPHLLQTALDQQRSLLRRGRSHSHPPHLTT